MYSNVFTCGWVCVGGVLWFWPQVDGGRVWRNLCEEGSRQGEHSEPLTLWHIVNSHPLQAKPDTDCFPPPDHGCHSLGGYIKMIYSFLRAKNSDTTKINLIECSQPSDFNVNVFAGVRGRAGSRLPPLCGREQFIENTSHVGVWLNDWALRC